MDKSNLSGDKKSERGPVGRSERLTHRLREGILAGVRNSARAIRSRWGDNSVEAVPRRRGPSPVLPHGSRARPIAWPRRGRGPGSGLSEKNSILSHAAEAIKRERIILIGRKNTSFAVTVINKH